MICSARNWLSSQPIKPHARFCRCGKLLAAKAQEKGVDRVVFDRAGLLYHGIIRAVAEGAREGGLKF